MVIKIWIKRIVTYCIGIFLMALSTNIAVRSGLGVMPITSVTRAFSLITNIELGNMTIIIFSIYVFFQLVILGKKFQPIQLLQIPFAFLFGKFVTLSAFLVTNIDPTTYLTRFLLMVCSIILSGIGIKLHLFGKLIPQAPDGLAMAISTKFNFEFADVKNVFDIGSVLVAIVVTLIFMGKVQGVREGTILGALGVGRVIAMTNRYLDEPLNEFIFN